MKIHILWGILMISLITNAQVKDCHQFKEGFFKIDHPKYGLSVMHRSGDKQIEYGALTGVKIELTVDWSEKCVYTLALDKILENPGKDLIEKFILNIEILEISEDGYRQRSSMVNSDLVLESEVKKISEQEFNDIVNGATSLENLDSFKEEFGKDICDCFSKADMTKEVKKDFFISCFTEQVKHYKDDIDKMVLHSAVDSLDAYTQGYSMGQELMYDMQKQLIHQCDPYYKYLEAMRESGMQSVRNKETKEIVIDSLSKLIKTTNNLDFLWERGTRYFAFNELEKAEKDFRDCIQEKPDDFKAKFFLAWVLETKGAYEESIKLYEEVYQSTQQPQFTMFLEIAKRKSKEE